MKNKDICFCSMLDFFPKKEKLKAIYQTISLDEKYIYKMYVYSLPFDDDKTKDLIWEYLNGWKESEKEFINKYTKKKEKADKRREYENKDTNETIELE